MGYGKLDLDHVLSFGVWGHQIILQRWHIRIMMFLLLECCGTIHEHDDDPQRALEASRPMKLQGGVSIVQTKNRPPPPQPCFGMINFCGFCLAVWKACETVAAERSARASRQTARDLLGAMALAGRESREHSGARESRGSGGMGAVSA